MSEEGDREAERETEMERERQRERQDIGDDPVPFYMEDYVL